MEPDLLITFSITFVSLVVFLLIGLYIKRHSLLSHRIKHLEDYQLHLSKTATRMRGEDAKERAYARENDEKKGFFAWVSNQLHYKNKGERDRIRILFQKAGWRSENSMVTYALLKTFIIFPVGFICWIYTTYFIEAQILFQVSLVAGSALIASKSIDFYVKRAIQKRQNALRRGFPDALDLMVICAESGLSLNALIQRVSNDIAPLHPELGYELQLLAVEINMLASRTEALQNFSQRLDEPICKNIVSSLVQSEEYGTPISQTMRTLSEEFRFDRLMNAEQRAAKLPVLMAGPLVLFIFPSLFIVLLGPVFIKVTGMIN